MKRFVIRFFSVGLAALLLFVAAVAGIYFGLPSAYTQHFQRGFIYQYRHLESLQDERKIITIGSSNVAFGVDSILLSELTGLPACNLGVNAGMGLSYMFDSAKKFIGEGDIVVYPLWSFSEGDYGYALIWLTLDGEHDMALDFMAEHPMATAQTIGSAAWRKIFHVSGDVLLEQVKGFLGGNMDEDIYLESSFDPETGSMTVEREAPLLSYDEMVAQAWEFSADHPLDDALLEYIGAYASFCREQGASFYVVFPPIVREAIVDHSPENIQSYTDYVTSAFGSVDVPVIMNMDDALLPYDCSYNAPSHMNSKGMDTYTRVLADCLLPYV